MLNIIICTHDDIYLQKLDSKVRLYLTRNNKIKYQIIHCRYIHDLINYSLNDETILLLDNDWLDTSGIMIAKELRQLTKNFILILLAHYMDDVLEAFHINTFRYILKSQPDTYFYEALTSSVNQLSVDEAYITIKFVGYPKKNIYLKNIIYLESDQHKIYFHLINDAEPKYIYSSWYSLLSQFKTQKFIRIHQSYLINRQYLLNVQHSQVKLIQDIELPISQKYITKIKKYWENK